MKKEIKEMTTKELLEEIKEASNKELYGNVDEPEEDNKILEEHKSKARIDLDK